VAAHPLRGLRQRGRCDRRGWGRSPGDLELAIPEDACNEVYATEGYESSVANMQGMSLATDNVFGDGYSLQLAEVSGTVDDGYTATLRVPI
jgi:hypothetical protein